MKLNQGILKPVAILALVTIVISGIGFIYYRSQLNGAPATESIESGIPDGFVRYQNQELGLSFFYPREWGEVKYEKDTRNHPEEAEKWEPIKSHFLTFSNSDTYIVISPSNWKFTGPESEWDFPALSYRTFDNYREEVARDARDSNDLDSILLNTAKELAFLYYTEFDDSLYIEGVKLISLPRINAGAVELRRNDFDFDHSCLTEHEDDQYGRYYTALNCFSSQYREQFVKTLQSIKTI